MNHLVRQILEAVRDGRVLPATRELAKRVLAREDQASARREAAAAARAARPKKKLGGATEHHRKARREEEREEEATSAACRAACEERTRLDHRGHLGCEACHRSVMERLDDHHLTIGAAGRVDDPALVMLLCRRCHTLDPKSAHRSPRHFAQTVVLPWLQRHGYPTPNRKEYR